VIVYLEIVWDGQVQGLQERRLSLEAFGPALRQLLSAVRRIASDLELQARGPGERRAQGRLAKEASNLDVQVETIRANSPVTLKCAIVPVNMPARPLLADLPERTIEHFLHDIERESQGSPAHYRARKFLQALPPGLAEQRYVFRRADGSVVREIQIGRMAIAQPMRSPYLAEVSGVLVGLGFEEGRSEVKVRASNGELVSAAATPEQVEEALGLRLRQVELLAVVEQTRMKLLRLSEVSLSPPDEATRTRYVFETWDELLKRLAK
jgi:hypothetical protein